MNPADPELPNTPDLVEEPDDFKSMLIGATLIFVVSMIPYVSLASACCLPQIVGALLAVHLFTAKYSLTLSAGKAMKLGIFTCLMGMLAAWAVGMALLFLFDYQPGAKEIEMIVLKLVGMTGNPDAVEQTRQQMEQQRAQGVGLAQIAVGLFGTVAFAGIAGVIGGAIGAALFKRGPKEMKQ